MKLKLLIAGLIALIPIPVLADIPSPSNNWVVTARSPQGDLMLVDLDTTSKSGTYAGFWFQINHPNNTVDRVYAVANCTNQTLVPLWAVSARGQVITENKAVEGRSPVRVPTGSLAEGAYKYACFGNKPKSFQELATERAIAQMEAINRAMGVFSDSFR
jgi:hypothetical protein